MDLLVPLHIERWEVDLTKPEPSNKLNQLKIKDYGRNKKHKNGRTKE